MSNITCATSGSVLTIAFDRPEKMNALTRDMYADLARALNDAAGDFAIRAVILTSTGDHFTAGNDIRDFMEHPPTTEDSTVAAFLGAILEFPKPLVAAVKGNAVGVGTTMLLHCDVVVADPGAHFSMPFVSLGLVPEAGSSLLFPALVGYQRAAKIFMTGETFSAESGLAVGKAVALTKPAQLQAAEIKYQVDLSGDEYIGVVTDETFSAESAKEMGLVAEISADPIVEAMKIATQIAAQPPTAIINTKALIKASKHDAVAAVMKAEFELFSLALTSEEAMEAFMNFMAKKAADKEKGGK